ncbi:hypothetical protein [Roseibium salinum]|uniref:DUF4148 domain-containing protein n=1 Tax=Roseibium salinum TaxID=1604349 RepID=A0ABT3R9K6_9HYPH|nr:hypothetical protein [Roseibium sp. DSM 29163]MCX2725678.1 hypothetical protein [Roseibium sp. DSM 29163]
MHTSKKLLSILATAAVLSGASVATAQADNLFDRYGDATGNRPLSIYQQQEFNAKALRDAAGNRLLILQHVGTLNGEEPLSQDLQKESIAKIHAAGTSNARHAMPFQGDWNGTAKAGFPHR